jgi:hypothetical protein
MCGCGCGCGCMLARPSGACICLCVFRRTRVGGCMCICLWVHLSLRAPSHSQGFCFSGFCNNDHSLQADGEGSLYTTKLLYGLVDYAPLLCCPAAIKGNVTPGLVRVLRDFGSHPSSVMGTSFKTSNVCVGVKMALRCLCQLLQGDNDHRMGMWQSAHDSGIVPVISDLLTICAGPNFNIVRTLCTCFVLVTPHEQEGRWAGKLPQAVERLLTATAGEARARATNTVISMCILDRRLFVDSSTWGLSDVLKDLAANSDPETGAAAQELLRIAFPGLEVCGTLIPARCAFCIVPFAL